MFKTKNVLVKDNENLLFFTLFALLLGPVAKSFGLNLEFYFFLSLFPILFEAGIGILIAFARLIKYFLKRKEEDLSSAIKVFGRGIIRIWVFSVLVYIFGLF